MRKVLRLARNALLDLLFVRSTQLVRRLAVAISAQSYCEQSERARLRRIGHWREQESATVVGTGTGMPPVGYNLALVIYRRSVSVRF
jgi:hypothetical protein